MKILYSWLKEFVALDISPTETASVLARLGIEVSSVQHLGEGLHGVITADVLDVQKHPNADRLSVCKVNDGAQTFQVVCGASNVRSGIRVPLARVGATLPGGMKIQAAKLRGVESQGMICSAAELGLAEQSEGIMILSPDTPAGKDIRPILGLDDALIEIEITPNRRDVLSILGIARELAAGLALPLKFPEPRVRELDLPSGTITLHNEAPEACPRYIARYIRDVHIGPSPEWLVQRLTRCGMRSINNIVDITNYIMLELGQPMHAFDANKLKGRKIRIRNAHAGETLLMLDGKRHSLDKEMLVIADDENPIALAGVMGGEESAISPATTEILLESAAFQPTLIRQASKKLGIVTESSYRFERGTDWNMVAFASVRAAQLIQELAGGMGYKPIDHIPRPYVPVMVQFRTERVRKFLGIDLKDAAIVDMLRRLGCIITTGTEKHLVTVPSWRLDLTTEADLMEEVARMVGYENIPARLPTIRISSVPTSPAWTFERKIVQKLMGLGLSEAYNYSLMGTPEADLFPQGIGLPAEAKPIALANPLSQESSLLRTTLIPGLLRNALHNFHHQSSGVRLFEISRVFFQDHTGTHELRRLGLLLGGTIQPAQWRQKSQKADFYAMTGLLESFLDILRISQRQWTASSIPAFHPKRSATLQNEDHILGWVGELHPSVLAWLDTKEPLVAAELDLDTLMSVRPTAMHYHPISVFPAVLRDISFIVEESISYETVEKALRNAAGSLLESCSLMDLFRGPSIGTERKSMTLSLTFRHKEQTLTDQEIEKTMEKIKEQLQKTCQAVMRA